MGVIVNINNKFLKCYSKTNKYISFAGDSIQEPCILSKVLLRDVSSGDKTSVVSESTFYLGYNVYNIFQFSIG